MAKSKLLKEFHKLSSTIIDNEYLDKYIEFCITNDVGDKINGETTSHHILPMAKTLPFAEFSNLKVYTWNKAELYYADHYYAHYLLYMAINHFSTIFAFTSMHNKDFKLGRITENDLISKDEFTIIWKERNKKISENNLELVSYNTELITKASYIMKNRILSEETISKLSDRMTGDNNIVHMDGVVDKIRDTKSSTIIDGKNLDTISAERAAETMKKEFINEKGETTTQYKENGKKLSAHLLQIEENGKTKAYNKNKLFHEKLRQKGKWYKVLNIFDSSYEQILCAVDVRKISPGLEKCVKDNYLGKSKFGTNYFFKRGKQELIGLYVERLR